jgi:hypothetical protein
MPGMRHVVAPGGPQQALSSGRHADAPCGFISCFTNHLPRRNGLRTILDPGEIRPGLLPNHSGEAH